MIKIKKFIKFLLPILILAIFVFSPASVTANIGLTIGHNGLTLDSFNNLLYGNLSPASHASSSFFLFQKNSSDVVRLDNFGNFTTLGNIGIGLSNPSSALQIANNNWISALNAGGSGSINMFKVNSNNQIEVGAALNIGSFEFTPDSGLVSFLDMPVTSASAIGTPHGYIFKTDSENILTIYSESNGSGGIQNKRVGINTFLPGSALEIRGGGSTSASSALNVTNSGAVSSLFVRNDGNIGIGLTNPAYALDVNGNVNLNSVSFGITPGESQLQALATVDYVNNKVGSGGGSSLWSENGSNIYYSLGNVGIGTISPTFKFQVHGSAAFASGNLVISEDGRIYGANDIIDFGYPNIDGGSVVARINSYDGSGFFLGNVGIGTTAPGYKLDVNGAINATSLLVNGSPVGGGSGLWTANGSNIYYDSGNIGVGTSVASAARITLADHTTTAGGIRFRSAATAVDLYSSGSNILRTAAAFYAGSYRVGTTEVITSGRVLRGANGTASAPAFSFSADTNTGMYSGTNDILRFATGGVDRLSIIADGNVGIGLTNPASKVEITQSSDAYNGGLAISNNASTQRLFLWVDSNSVRRISGGASENSSISINGTGTTGNVGIGTTAPAYKLDVNGTINATSVLVNGSPISGGGSSVWSENGTDIIYYNSGKVGIGTSLPSYLLTIENSSSGENILGELTGSFAKTWSTANREGFLLNSRYTGQSLNWNVALINWGYADSIANGGSRLGFDLVNTSGDWLNVMTMTGSGNVGIGTTAPAEKLDVEGNVEADAYYYSSDIRLKTDIKALNNSLEKIKKLNPVSFAWKKDGVLSQGFIAQEVEWVLPELVKTNQETNLKSVQYANLTAILVAGMKEQQIQIEKLQAEVKLLQQKLSGLEK